jgi:hypothetical protein
MPRGRKSRKKVSIHEVSDRLDSYANLPAGAKVAPIEVDDPHSKPGQTDKLIVMRTVRDDPLGAMHAAGSIDNAQFLAGRKWQLYYERIAFGTLRAGALADFVDGGGRASAGDRDEAMEALKGASKLLGKDADLLIHDVLGLGHTINDVAKNRGNYGGQARLKLTIMLDNALETLVIFFGLAIKSRVFEPA